MLFLFDIVLEFLDSEIKQKKVNKRQPVKKEMKLSLFSDDMVIYIENSKKYITTKQTETLLELISGFSKVTGYKINIQKSVYFYTLA